MGFVARTGNSWMANDINKDPYYIKGFLGEVLTKSELCVPINLDEKIIGILDVQSIHVNDFGRMDLIALEAVAKQVAIAIENARLFQRTNRWAEEMVALREVDMAILSSLEQDEVFEITLDQLGKVIDYDTAAIKIFTPDGLDKMIAGRGPITGDQLMWEGFELKNSKINREMMETKKPVVIHNTHTDERFEPVGDWEEFHSWVGAPLLVRDELIGYLAVEKKTPNFYDEKAAQLLADFAHAAAIALENARLYEDLQQELAERKKAEEKLEKSLERLKGSFDATVKALAETANHRDPYTTSHQQRVTQLACAIAWEMNLSEERIEGIRIAGQIHDIGKMSVPAEILSKPSERNDLEMDLIKTHVQVGYDILEGIEFPWPVADMVLQHHERMDGSGYPNGISGEDIMLEARILAVADVVEAMASYRPYRPAKGIDKALKEISQNKGKLYDPEVVDTCIKLFGEKGFEFEEDESDD